MGPLFIVTERFDPRRGSDWHSYVNWSKLNQLTEVVSLDSCLCPPVVREIRDEDWPHIVNEDFMLDYFVDLDYLLRRCGGVADRNLLCVFRNPEEHATPPSGPHDFRFEGCDLVDVQGGISALTNCGGFPLQPRAASISWARARRAASTEAALPTGASCQLPCMVAVPRDPGHAADAPQRRSPLSATDVGRVAPAARRVTCRWSIALPARLALFSCWGWLRVPRRVLRSRLSFRLRGRRRWWGQSPG